MQQHAAQRCEGQRDAAQRYETQRSPAQPASKPEIPPVERRDPIQGHKGFGIGFLD